jgi:hypothetical protein
MENRRYHFPGFAVTGSVDEREDSAWAVRFDVSMMARPADEAEAARGVAAVIVGALTVKTGPRANPTPIWEDGPRWFLWDLDPAECRALAEGLDTAANAYLLAHPRPVED